MIISKVVERVSEKEEENHKRGKKRIEDLGCIGLSLDNLGWKGQRCVT